MRQRKYRAQACITPGSRLELVDEDGVVHAIAMHAPTANVACAFVVALTVSPLHLYWRIIGSWFGDVDFTVDELEHADEPT